MEVRWPLLGLALVVLLPIAYLLLARFGRRPVETSEGLPVAHVERLRALPRYRELARQQLVWSQVQLAAVSLVLIGAVWLAMRPVGDELVDDPGLPGDVVLCLDGGPAAASGVKAALGQARGVVDAIGVGRIGIHVFQRNNLELLPLTDDLGQAVAEIASVRKHLPLPEGDGVSGSTGDGLVECARAFDRSLQLRGRAVLLVTAGRQDGGIHTLAEGAAFARDRGVAVYVVPAGAEGRSADLASAAESTGGALVKGSDQLGRAWALEQRRLDPPPSQVHRDKPFVPTALVLIGMLGLVAAGMRGMFR